MAVVLQEHQVGLQLQERLVQQILAAAVEVAAVIQLLMVLLQVDKAVQE